MTRAPAPLLAFVLCFVRGLAAQGCASCYTTAAAGGAQTAHALRSGIIVLLLPPAFMFLGLVYGVKRWRQTRADVSLEQIPSGSEKGSR